MKAEQDTKLQEVDGRSFLCCRQADIRNSSIKQVNVSSGTFNTFAQKAAGFLSLKRAVIVSTWCVDVRRNSYFC